MEPYVTARFARPPKVALVLPVGPGTTELWRATDLLKSLVAWEPHLAWCVIVDDAVPSRGLSELSLFPSSCRAVTLSNERQGKGQGKYGALCAAILAAFEWIHANTDADFLLKMDTDALAIGPFAQRVHELLMAEPDCGLVGTIGDRCNPSETDLQELRRESFFLRTRKLLTTDRSENGKSLDLQERARTMNIPIEQAEVFMRILPHLDEAIQRGFWWDEFCQGGAYVVSRAMVDRMANAGYIEMRDLWTNSHFGEDRAMGMYARAVGLRVRNFSGRGEVFGVHNPGLAAEPAELVNAGYALIHSVKNDRRFTETTIRDYFRVRAPTP